MSNIEVSEAINLFLTGGKLPAVDGSDLTGLSEIPELNPTHLILNELGTAIAPNNTLAYSGDFLSRHDGTTAGGEVLSNTQSTRYPASVIKNKTILRKNIASKLDGGAPAVRLSIKVNGPNISRSTQLGILQVYACWANTGEAVPDTGTLLYGLSANRYYLFKANVAKLDLIFKDSDDYSDYQKLLEVIKTRSIDRQNESQENQIIALFTQLPPERQQILYSKLGEYLSEKEEINE